MKRIGTQAAHESRAERHDLRLDGRASTIGKWISGQEQDPQVELTARIDLRVYGLEYYADSAVGRGLDELVGNLDVVLLARARRDIGRNPA